MVTKKNQLKILFVEDIASDVDLAVRELRKEKLNFEFTSVCTRKDLVKALKEFTPDVIISDYMMPAFNGLQALKEAKSFNSNIPFILYTGSVNESIAVECIKAGAQDYVMKEHMKRLPFAVKEALEQIRIFKEKRASELLLKENEEKLQSIFSVAPVGIGLVVNRVLVEVNDTFCNLIGYKRNELIGKSARVLYPSDEEFDFVGKEKYGQIAEKGIGSVETKFKCKDGKIINIILSSAPLDRNDLLKGVTFTVEDITDKKKAEKELITSYSILNASLESTADGILIADGKGGIIKWNQKFAKMWRLPEEILNGHDDNAAINYILNQLIDPDKFLATVKDLYANLEKSSFDKLEFKDGRIFERYSQPQRIDNEVVGRVWSFRDVTERYKAQEALILSEEKYRRIFQNVQDLFYETSLDGTILEITPSVELLSKGYYRREELIGKSIYNFYSDPKQRSALLFHLKEKGSVSDFEITLINGDGSKIPCSLSSKIIYDINGHPDKIIGSAHDITERKNASEALRIAKEKAEASDRLKTDFLNNISHEVRTPLNGILGFAEIISVQDLPEKEKKDSLAMLFESSNRLLNTVTNYMDISLLTSGSLSINNKDFIPATILKKIYNNIESLCLHKKLKLFLEIPENSEDFIINSDPEICQKILSHFLDNAVKFTEKGSIHFGFNYTDEQLEFFVRDTGSGINLNSFNIIFDRFVKESQNPYKVTEGSGLGLSIARGMSDAIGAKIRLESEPGAGSCFFLSIPVTKDAELSSPGTFRKGLQKVIQGSKILIAEDDIANSFYLNALVTRETGAEVFRASNGREAIEIFKANQDINLILMDIKMPVIDGFEATRQIKLINPEVNIIAITAYAMSGDEDRIIASGCDGYLSKPISKKSLLEKIGEFISIR